MTSQQDQIALRNSLDHVLGSAEAATLWSMLQIRDDLATKSDVSSARDELRREMSLLRGELRGEMSDLRVELKGEMSDLRVELKGEMSELRSEMNNFIRTFVRVQAGTVVGVSGIVYALVQLT